MCGQIGCVGQVLGEVDCVGVVVDGGVVDFWFVGIRE